MITFIIGTVFVLIVVGLLALRRTPSTSTTGVTLDIQGRRMIIPPWAWKQISDMVSDTELHAFKTAREAAGRSHDYTYEIIVIGRVQAVAWNWMTTTPQGRTWLTRTHPDLVHLPLLD